MALFDNCVAAWKLSDLTDSTGRGNTLTNNNSATFSTGLIGNAAYFDGSNQFLSIADNADVRGGDVDWTIALLFWATDFDDSSGDVQLVSKDINTPANSRDYTIDILPSGVPRFYINGGGAYIAIWGSAVSTGAWHFLIAWHDSVNNEIGLSVDNGTPVTFSTGGAAPETSAAPLRIGARAYAGFEGYLNGRIDNVNIIKRVWNADERTEFYNSGNGLEFSSGSTALGLFDPSLRPEAWFDTSIV